MWLGRQEVGVSVNSYYSMRQFASGAHGESIWAILENAVSGGFLQKMTQVELWCLPEEVGAENVQSCRDSMGIHSSGKSCEEHRILMRANIDAWEWRRNQGPYEKFSAVEGAVEGF